MPGKTVWHSSHEAPVRLANIGIACADSGLSCVMAQVSKALRLQTIRREVVLRAPGLIGGSLIAKLLTLSSMAPLSSLQSAFLLASWARPSRALHRGFASSRYAR